MRDKGTANAYWLFMILINLQWAQTWLIYHLPNILAGGHQNNRLGHVFAIYLHLSNRWNVFFYTVFICKHVCIYAVIYGWCWIWCCSCWLLLLNCWPRAMVKWNFDKHKCLTWLWGCQTKSDFYALIAGS